MTSIVDEMACVHSWATQTCMACDDHETQPCLMPLVCRVCDTEDTTPTGGVTNLFLCAGGDHAFHFFSHLPDSQAWRCLRCGVNIYDWAAIDPCHT